jgi:hypothetical protein
MTNRPQGDELITIGRYFSPAEAHAHRLALEEAGIDACVLDEEAGGMYGVGIGARLQVRAVDRDAALRALQGQSIPASMLPDELAEPPCPVCASREVTQAAEIPEVPADSVKEWPSRVWRYQCAACGHSWFADDDTTHGKSS